MPDTMGRTLHKELASVPDALPTERVTMRVNLLIAVSELAVLGSVLLTVL